MTNPKKFIKQICETCGKEFEEYYIKKFCCNTCRIYYKYGDLTNKKYNRLLVEKLVTSNGRRRWRCLCDCGNRIIAATDVLISGSTKSCGCYLKEKISQINKLPKEEASFNTLYSSYKKSAKEKNLIFTINKEQFKELTHQDCFYCGTKPSKEFKRKNMNGYYKYNGLDRVNNDFGYEVENVVSCCTKCNIMKKAQTQKDFLSHIEKIYNHKIQKG